jgi:hypothetical protein
MRSGLSIGTGSVAVTLGIEALECTCTPIPAGLLAVGSWVTSMCRRVLDGRLSDHWPDLLFGLPGGLVAVGGVVVAKFCRVVALISGAVAAVGCLVSLVGGAISLISGTVPAICGAVRWRVVIATYHGTPISRNAVTSWNSESHPGEPEMSDTDRLSLTGGAARCAVSRGGIFGCRLVMIHTRPSAISFAGTSERRQPGRASISTLILALWKCAATLAARVPKVWSSGRPSHRLTVVSCPAECQGW